MESEGKFHKYLVPGLDVFVGDPDILNPFEEKKKRADRLYIPKEYVDRAADFEGEQSARGDACGTLIDHFTYISQQINHSGREFFTLPNGTQVFFVEPKNYFGFRDFQTSSKCQAMCLAQHLLEQKIATKDEIAIYTGSRKLAGPASIRGIDIAHVNPEVYMGRRRVNLPFEFSHLWFSNKRITKTEWEECFPSEPPLKINEFVEFVSDSPILTGNRLDMIGRFDAEENALIPLRHKFLSIKDGNPARIYPRNAGQAMLIEALLTPPSEIPLVICMGIFGTGKTFLATGAGYFGALSEDYDHVFVCPRDGALGAEIGFVPGDTTEKTRVKARPIEDNLREIIKIMNNDKKKSRGPALKNQVETALREFFEFEPLINMGGRSLSDMFLIFDEFQDTERYQATALLSRLGNSSKAIALGDPLQTTNPHLGPTSNGLSFSASRLAGKPEAAVITLFPNEIERSDAVRAIAEYLLKS